MNKIKQSEKALSKISDDLSAISVVPDQKTLQERNNNARQERLLKRKARLLYLKGVKQNIDERKNYANLIFKLIAWWLGMIMVLLVAQGLFPEKGYFKLSENLFLAIIGGTTINVLGLFIIVINYLFPKQRKHK